MSHNEIELELSPAAYKKVRSQIDTNNLNDTFETTPEGNYFWREIASHHWCIIQPTLDELGVEYGYKNYNETQARWVTVPAK
ncbi:hypothetical protein F4827_006587 [Paraburkholderia bannensis]|uniref:Uncharacterized protein n=1 Tax=Paraburkholderia bannensis TaxID=765414 RepID=A0A7W9U478_9BURK|nr:MULTISPECIES: hypothetical protein [Paraburkholderia]MBB3261667.1 hypothetical protein [Paraburkholderia sp. WP4_3_2]MBB6106711.1 hypothetical protein [Paraburkholderia bannensis]